MRQIGGDNMADEQKKVTRTRRTPEKKIAEIDAKIAKLEEQKAKILEPIRKKELLDKAAASMSLEEMAERLGIEL